MAKAPRKRLPDGQELVVREVLGTFGRTVTTIAARPGSFEWRSARGMWTGPQDQAGRRARALWEACGLSGPPSVDWSMSGSGRVRKASHGPQESILGAFQRAGYLSRSIGMLSEARLRAYLLTDTTVAEVAARWGYNTRDMTAIIRADLDAVAAHFGYEPKGVL